MMPDKVILIFLRAPQLGKVKSRLAKIIGPELALSLYRCFVRDTLETARGVGIPVHICFYPAESSETVISWLGNGFIYHPQTGSHLGRRMADAFLHAFQSGFNQAVLIGTDIPDLPRDILSDALNALQSNDAAIGPSADGGYYLIGFNANGYLPAVFEGISWGKKSVFADTMRIFETFNHKVYKAPMWRDIDEYEDLLSYLERNSEEHMSGKSTARLITHTIGK